MIQFFNDAMKNLHTMKIQGNPVVGAQINYDKNFVFIDFRTPEEATAAMSLDGIRLREHLLKVRRPNNFTNSNESSKTAINTVSSIVPDSFNKLHISGLPLQMTEDLILQLMNNIGPLNAFNLVKDGNTGYSKGYAYCEFTTDEATEKALQYLNNVDLAGKKLQVARANDGKKVCTNNLHILTLFID